MSQKTRCAFAWLSAIFLASLATQSQAQTSAEFFKGKSIEFIVPAATGGGFDAYARAAAPYLKKHMPGNPTINIANMPGAGGIAMLRRMYDVSPKDGTVLAMLNRVALTLAKLDPPKVGVDLKRMELIGGMVAETGACYAFSASGVKSLEDLRTRKVVFADTSVGGVGYIYSSILAALYNNNVTHVLGYLNSADAWLAMERGEAEANCVGWNAVLAQRPAWVAEKKINVLVQFGEKSLPGLEHVPLIYDLKMTPQQRQAIAFLIRNDGVSRTIIAPPGTMPERLEAWRTAFTKTMEDPEFLAYAASLKLEIDVTDHRKLREIIDSILDTPQDAVDLAKQIVK